MDGWNTTFLLGRPIFRGYVSFREGISYALVNDHMAGWNDIPTFNRIHTSTQSGAPIFQPAMLDYRSVNGRLYYPGYGDDSFSLYWKQYEGIEGISINETKNTLPLKNGFSGEPRKKTSDTFHYTGCLIGILIMVYFHPQKLGSIIPYIMP